MVRPPLFIEKSIRFQRRKRALKEKGLTSSREIVQREEDFVVNVRSYDTLYQNAQMPKIVKAKFQHPKILINY